MDEIRETNLKAEPQKDQQPLKNPILNDYSSRYWTRWLRSQSCVGSLKQPPKAGINMARHIFTTLAC